MLIQGSLFPWPTPIQTAISTIPADTTDQTHFDALYHAFLRLQRLSPIPYQFCHTETPVEAVWHVLVDILLLLERWNTLILCDASRWLQYMQPITTDPTKTIFYFPSTLIQHTLTTLSHFSWELVYDAHPSDEILLQVNTSTLFTTPTQLALSTEWRQQVQQDRLTTFHRLTSHWESLLREMPSPLTEESATPYTRVCYAAAFNTPSLMESLLATHTLSAILPPSPTQPGKPIDCLDPLHPLSIALSHHHPQILILLLADTTLPAMSGFDLLQALLRHHMLACIPLLVSMKLFPLAIFFEKNHWIFYASNGTTLSYHTSFLIACWYTLQHRMAPAFQIPQALLQHLTLLLLLHILHVTDFQHFTQLIEMPFWHDNFHQFAPELVWSLFDNLITYEALRKSLTEPPTIRDLTQLCTQIPVLPWLFAQLNPTQWHTLCNTAQTAEPSALQYLLQMTITVKYIEQAWRQKPEYQHRDGWLLDYMKAKKLPIPNIAVGKKTHRRQRYTDSLAEPLLQLLGYQNQKPILENTLPDTLFTWDNTAFLDEPLSLLHLVADCVVLKQFGIQHYVHTENNQYTILTTVLRVLEQLEQWTQVLRTDPALGMIPYLPDNMVSAYIQQDATIILHYPLVSLLQAIYLLSRLPWDTLALDLRDRDHQLILCSNLQAQLIRDYRTQFVRLKIYWQTVVAHMLETPNVDISFLQQVRLASTLGLTDYLHPLCETDPNLPMLSVPHEWSTFCLTLCAGHSDTWLSCKRYHKHSITLSDPQETLIFLLKQSTDWTRILVSIGLGWITPVVLLTHPPTAFTTLLGYRCEPDCTLLHLLIQHIAADPLAPTHAIADLVCVIFWVCLTHEVHQTTQLLSQFLEDADFERCFQAMPGERLGALLGALSAILDYTEPHTQLMVQHMPKTHRQRTQPIRAVCDRLTMSQWHSLLSPDNPSPFSQQLRQEVDILQKQYPALKRALTTTTVCKDTDETDRLAAELIAAETAAIAARASQKAKATALQQQQAEIQKKASAEKQAKIAAEKAAEAMAAKEAQAEARRKSEAKRQADLAALKAARERPIQRALAETQTLNALRAELSFFISHEKRSPHVPPNSPDDASTWLDFHDDRLTQWASHPHELSTEQSSSPTSSITDESPQEMGYQRILPPWLQALREHVSPAWPFLIPGHATLEDTEWHLWLIVPPTYIGDISLIPNALWGWQLALSEMTSVFIEHQSFPEFRFVPCLLFAGVIIHLTITQLSNPQQDVPRLLGKHMISLTATRINIHQGEWYLPHHKARQDLHDHVLDLCNPDRAIASYSPRAIAFTLKACAKYLIPSPEYRISLRLIECLRQALSQPAIAHRVNTHLAKYETQYPQIREFRDRLMNDTLMAHPQQPPVYSPHR